MELSKYIACICEGTAEEVIMDILLEHDKLIFNRNQLLEEAPIRCRDAKKFEARYLRKGFTNKISIIRILDSRRENFKLSKAYAHKVNVINIITAPKIEMLVIVSEKSTTNSRLPERNPAISARRIYDSAMSKTKPSCRNIFRMWIF